MTFVNPFILAGAGFVAVPIVLHLVMRRKPRLVEFPALRFVRQRHDTNRRQLRLRHLLLLLLRMMVIVLVALALARPSLKLSAGPIGSQKTPVAAAMVFDTSKRMDYRHENRTRLEVAQELALWVLTQLPPESKVAVLDSHRGPAAFQVDLGSAKHRLEQLETSADAQPMPDAVAEAARLLAESELERKEIYVFTDLARIAWPTEAAGRLQKRLNAVANVGVYLIDVSVAQPANLALGDLRLSGQTVSNRGTLRIETELTSVGMGDQHTVELYLLEPDSASAVPGARKPEKRGEQTVSLEPGQSRQMEFRVSNLGVGTHQGYIQILGQDALAADDRRYFTVEAMPAWQVLIAAPKPEKTYAVFFQEALAPESFRRGGLARFACEVAALEELRQKDLRPYAAVCLLDPKPLEPAVWQKLADYVAEGRGLAVWLGRNAEPVKSFNEKPAQDVLAGRLLRQARSPDGSLALAPHNLEHPALAAFRSVAGAVPWSRHPVYRYWQLDALPEGAHVLASFSDGSPALIERPLGKGKAITIATPASDNPNRDPWNLLPVGEAWPFVIIVNEMTAYLVGSGGQNLNYRAGETVSLDLAGENPAPSYLLTSPSGDQVRLTPDLKDRRLVIASADEPGNYRIQARGSNESIDRGFSVNLTADQTRLDRWADKDLAPFFGTLAYRVARGKEQIEFNVNTGRVGRELFGLLIFAAAVVLGFEHILANRFYSKG